MHNVSSWQTRQTLVVVALWLSVVVVVGYFGYGMAVPPILRGPIVLIGIAAPVVLSFFHRPFGNAVSRIPDAMIVAFHSWRILAGFAFLFYGEQELLATIFAHIAGYGDIAVAALVPLVLLLPESKNKYIGFHLFGLADFIAAVGTGLYFTIIHHPLQANLFSFPLLVVPWFGVGLSGASHIITLHRLLQNYQLDGSSRQQ